VGEEGRTATEEGAMKRDALSNEEVIVAFSDWRSQFNVGTFKGAPLVSDEKVAAEIAAVREFAMFIEPKLLAESTIAEINAFRGQIPHGSRSTYAGIEQFRNFRESVLKSRKTVRVRPDGSIQ
jgi:hypothetical protein